MSQPSRRRLRIERNGETGRVGDDCVSQWVKEVFTELKQDVQIDFADVTLVILDFHYKDFCLQ